MVGKKTISLVTDPNDSVKGGRDNRGFAVEVRRKRRSSGDYSSSKKIDVLTNDEVKIRLDALQNAASTLSESRGSDSFSVGRSSEIDDVSLNSKSVSTPSGVHDGYRDASDASSHSDREPEQSVGDLNAKTSEQSGDMPYVRKAAYASDNSSKNKDRQPRVTSYSTEDDVNIQSNKKMIYSAYSGPRSGVKKTKSGQGFSSGQSPRIDGRGSQNRSPGSNQGTAGSPRKFADKQGNRGPNVRSNPGGYGAGNDVLGAGQFTPYPIDGPLPLDSGKQHDSRRRSDRSVDDFSGKKSSGKKLRHNKGQFGGEGGKKMSKMAINRVLETDLEERMRSEAAAKRARNKARNADKPREVVMVVRDVQIPDFITVSELASRMAVQGSEVVRYLMKTGMMVTLNQTIDADIAELICTEFGHNVKRVSVDDVETEINEIIGRDSDKNTETRAPIVAVMGHVDHGKTTLLDTLRNTSVAKGESGGITQHVASYQVVDGKGRKITFIDTPGHAAFSKIRGRSAVITDIVILIVAADDGIKESTIESINYAKANNIPMVVAINKIDKPNINIDKVKTELMAQEILLEEYGGDVLSVNISALKNQNIDQLIDTVMLQAEMLELRANPNRSAVCTVLESRVDSGKGIVASVIVQNGTLNIGDTFVASTTYGKVRTIYDDKGNRIKSAEPSQPVEVVGFNKSAQPGDVFCVVDTEQKAREIAEKREANQKNSKMAGSIKTVEQLMQNKKDDVSKLKIIVKADVSGSLEAIATIIEAIHHDEVQNVIVSQSVGVISDSDVEFAKQSGAIIIGFRVGVINSAKEFARLNNVKILHNTVIYHITEEIKNIMSDMLSPIIEENYIGAAHVRKIFEISRFGTIAGCYVTDGLISRKGETRIKVKRDGKVVFEGGIKSMKHEKDEIREAKYNHECGILAEGFNGFLVDDIIECYEIVTKKRSV